MATHSSILEWEIPLTEEPCGPQSMGLQKSQTRLKRLNNNKITFHCKQDEHRLGQVDLSWRAGGSIPERRARPELVATGQFIVSLG